MIKKKLTLLLIQLKDNIYLNFEDLSENNTVNEKQKIEQMKRKIK